MRILNLKTFLLFLAPALLLYSLFYAGPIVSGLYYGFTDWKGVSFSANWIGLDNFRNVFSDPLFATALRNMLILSVVVIAVQHAISIFLAVLLDQKLRGVVWMRAVIFYPAILNTVVIGYIWSYMYSPFVGFLPKFFEALGLDTLAGIDWLGRTDTAIYAISFVIIWQYTGYSMMIYMAGLQGISSDIYESASIDGANARQKFFRITLPLLVPAITVNTVLSVIGNMKQFEHIWVMTQGGPANSTQVFGTLIYQFAFKTSQPGYGTAMAILLSVLIMLVTVSIIRALGRWEVKQ
ncbi:carbohydrate ABC transporter permease [Cohnella phaseoli]|uniref:Carbohydrate ABC transporter membrane protein 1 (CUT1 family) n=1 Tax=Cohnella phaseoli TaxID=456490 RepID=A0A3D9I0Y2_9BACL|nr:sugar ABC transporter permease [Cohnella phaseoli]RED55427.1 carbohydrate ABC transporter membrane protein 1 (CUT1 family) [Cohnella phaseoli]